MLESRGLLCDGEELTSNLPFGGHRCLQGLIIDDFLSVSIEEVAKVAGAELDGSAFTRKLGLCTLAAPASKRLGLSFLSLQLASLRATTDALHACLFGGWASCLMYRRALMSILDRGHSFADMSLVDQGNPKVLKMPRLVALLGILAPFMCADLAAPISTSVYASDASDLKGAIVKSEVGEDLARGLWRTGRKKGGYTRLLSREQALLAKIDSQWEEDVPDEKIEHPSKPLAMRYHFIEICGGAGKITKYADQEAGFWPVFAPVTLLALLYGWGRAPGQLLPGPSLYDLFPGCVPKPKIVCYATGLQPDWAANPPWHYREGPKVSIGQLWHKPPL